MIRYKKYQNQTKSTPLSGKWLARAVADETLDTRALAEHMAKHNTPYSQGAIHGVLKDMTSCIKELLLDGKNVKIDDLAIFSVGIRSKGAVTPEDFSTQGNIIGVRLRARATGNLSSASLKLTAKLREYTEYSNGEVTPGGGDSESPDEI
jgi:predicted histone-like DNA-binding protein